MKTANYNLEDLTNSFDGAFVPSSLPSGEGEVGARDVSVPTVISSIQELFETAEGELDSREFDSRSVESEIDSAIENEKRMKERQKVATDELIRASQSYERLKERYKLFRTEYEEAVKKRRAVERKHRESNRSLQSGLNARSHETVATARTVISELAAVLAPA